MEKEQIVKALECCKGESIPCSECIYVDFGQCQTYMADDAISLIREQEKRIEELETSCTKLTRKLHACKADTVRKMQKMLLAQKVQYGNITFRVVPVDDIDQIANQLLEETK